MQGKKQQPQGKQLNIELDEEEADGVYSNFTIISFSPSEFIIDFARRVPGPDKAKVHSRVLMSPLGAKLLLKTLKKNIDNYESKFSEIESPERKGQGIGFEQPQGPQG